MQRAGSIAKRYGLHPDTIRDWADQFEDFFSEGARKDAGTRREFTYEDEIILNTIFELRKQRFDFEQIRAQLAAGERMTTLPPTNEPVPQENALAVYTELKELKIKIADRDAEIERLRQQVLEDKQELIAMAREAENWKARYEILKEQIDGK